MRVLLLAAGRSRRVKPIEDKNFLRFCGKTLIHHQCDALRDVGLNDFVVIGGAHNLDRLKAFAKAFRAESPDVKIKVIEQEQLEQGMAGAVLSARDGGVKGAVLIVSANDVVDGEAYRLVADAAKNPSYDGVLLAKRVERYFPGGYLEVDKAGRIQRVVEKPGAGNEPSDLVNVVVHAHREIAVLCEALKAVKTQQDDRYEVALDQMIRQGQKIQALPYDGFWQAIKYPWHVLEIAWYFFERTGKHIAASAQIHERANIQGEVVIEKGAKIFAGATIVGPAYIGENCIIANNALVRESFLGAHCVIGFSTEVARSVLGDEVWTHSNYLGDSVIGNDVSFGAGSVTGNLRFDEGSVSVIVEGEKIDAGTPKLGLITGDQIRVGINTSFMPGVKVGSRSVIGAGLVIDRDVPADSFVKGKMELEIRPNKAAALPSRKAMRAKLK